MPIKTITLKDATNFYPANYNYEKLKKFNLYDDKFNDNYLYYYSYYRFYFESYLKEVLNLTFLNNKLKNENNASIFNKYQNISYLDLDYVFIRNNIYLDRLTIDEFATFKELCPNNDSKKLRQFISNTYKKVIVFDINQNLKTIIRYDGFSTNNNALVIGILTEKKDNYEALELKYTNILNIPVSIFNYYPDIEDNKIFYIENLNLENEKKQQEIIKKYPKYLPLGSVVILKNGWKKVMIIGYAPINIDNKDEIYDYLACLYPEGIVRTDFNILFNHKDIKEIKAIGLIDEEEQNFMNNLPDLIGNTAEQKEKLAIIKNTEI